MATHRKPRVGRPSVRTAFTLATATAASVGVLTHPVQADPRLSPDQVRAQLDALNQQAEAATQDYDGAVAQAAELQRQASNLQQQAADTDAAANELRTRLGRIAAAEYRDGGMDPAVRLLTSAHPDDYLRLAGSLSQVSTAQQQLLDQYAVRRHALSGQQATLATRLAALQAQQQRITAARARIKAALASAQRLLDTLDAAQRAALQHSGGSGGGSDSGNSGGGSGSSSGGSAAELPVSSTVADVPASGRAAAAVAFARAQLGKPYVWGATGPGSFDCSGLTQAAWRSAGVSLPRTTYEQIDAGRRVSASALEPGDLVFYYSGITHVALYVGGGRIIHAPHPGAAVEYAPVGEMPISGAVRPA